MEGEGNELTVDELVEVGAWLDLLAAALVKLPIRNGPAEQQLVRLVARTKGRAVYYRHLARARKEKANNGNPERMVQDAGGGELPA